MSYENIKMLNHLKDLYGDKIDTLYVLEGHKANQLMKYLKPNLSFMNYSIDSYDLQKSCVSINSIIIRGIHYVFVVYNVQSFCWTEKYPFREGMKTILDLLSSKYII